CPTPAATSAAPRFLPEVWKKSITALSSNDGEFATSTTTRAPARALARPSPVMVLMPVFGAAAMTAWPACFSFATTLEPIRPVPPMTTIFMALPPADPCRTLVPHRVEGLVHFADMKAGASRRRTRRGAYCCSDSGDSIVDPRQAAHSGNGVG